MFQTYILLLAQCWSIWPAWALYMFAIHVSKIESRHLYAGVSRNTALMLLHADFLTMFSLCPEQDELARRAGFSWRNSFVLSNGPVKAESYTEWADYHLNSFDLVRPLVLDLLLTPNTSAWISTCARTHTISVQALVLPCTALSIIICQTAHPTRRWWTIGSTSWRACPKISTFHPIFTHNSFLQVIDWFVDTPARRKRGQVFPFNFLDLSLIMFTKVCMSRSKGRASLCFRLSRSPSSLYFFPGPWGSTSFRDHEGKLRPGPLFTDVGTTDRPEREDMPLFISTCDQTLFLPALMMKRALGHSSQSLTDLFLPAWNPHRSRLVEYPSRHSSSPLCAPLTANCGPQCWEGSYSHLSSFSSWSTESTVHNSQMESRTNGMAWEDHCILHLQKLRG